MSDGPVASNVALDGPGRALAKAREAAEITQREVSDALNLPVSTIDAIEQDDRDRLPADVFTRGYIRAYARLLQLDPGPLVAAFGGSTEAQDLSATFGDTAPGGHKAIRLSMSGFAMQLPPGLTPARLLAAAGSVVVLIILAFWFFSADAPAEPDDNQISPAATSSAQMQTGDDVTPSMAENPTRAVTAEAMPSALTQAQPTAAEVQPGAAEVLEVEQVQASESDRQNDDAQSEPETAPEGQAQVQDVTPRGVRRLTASGADRLSIEFTEECWVEIKDPEGNLLFGNLGAPGSRLEFVGAAPFRVLLGYAPGAMLRYNAEPVALGPHTRNNVASLVLGQ